MGIVKLCGITNAADMQSAAATGADLLGMVVDVHGARRSITVSQAQMLTKIAPARSVVVLVNHEFDNALRIAKAVAPGVIQLSGDEPEEYVRRLIDTVAIRVVKAVHISESAGSAEVNAIIRRLAGFARAGCEYALLDTKVGAQFGGSGVRAELTVLARIVSSAPLPIIVAGGLTPENVGGVIQQVKPAGVDVSSGTESSLGRKDALKLERFVNNARAAFGQ